MVSPPLALATTARTAFFSLVKVWARQPSAAGHWGCRMLPGAQLHLVDGGEEALVHGQGRVVLVEVLAEVGGNGAVAGHEVDGAGGLVVAAGGVEGDLLAVVLQLQVEGVPLVAHSVVVHVVAGGVAAGRYRLQGLPADELRCLLLVLPDGCEGSVPAEASEDLQNPFLGPLRRRHQGAAVPLQQVRVA